jgi:hypothetical protein
VSTSVENAKRPGHRDEWLAPSEAQYRLLTADRPAFVKNAYNTARTEGGNKFSVTSEARQVAILGSLGIFPKNCRAALEGLGLPVPPPLPEADADAAVIVAFSTAVLNPPIPKAPARDRIIVATGHRVDESGRPTPRFPDTAQCIEKAKAWLHETIEAERAQTEGSIFGIGGAASGTDLLFHEVCVDLGIPTKVVLPIPIEHYRRKSVADGGPKWIEKFTNLVNTNPPIVLSDDDSADLPLWARSIENYSVFQRGNIWMMEAALLRPNADVTLLALWNGKAGDGPGGTEDMVKLAKDEGAKAFVQNSDELFGLA